MKTHEDAWMRQAMESDRAYIEDAGFSDRVIAALPPRRTFDLRSRVLGGTAVVACVLGLVLLPGGTYLTTLAARASAILAHQPPLGIAAAGLGATMLVLWALLAAEER
jgi:hypothetical protein